LDTSEMSIEAAFQAARDIIDDALTQEHRSGSR
ncbi:MAG: cytidylate kinase, partial [Rhizobiaceae bacterium]|nr:cytidylate kinase [Rhizobiaceae bacterium]